MPHTPNTTERATLLIRIGLHRLIEKEGGAYILPEQNPQPDFMPRLASIRLRGLVGIGATEAEAQSDFFRQAEAAAQHWATA